jgi:VWFA-related protein
MATNTHHEGRRTIAAAAVAVALACIAGGTAQGRQAAQAGTPVPGQGQPTFRAGTVVVEVDVIVRDKAGRFVTDLQPGDFEVQDEGKPVEVSALYRVVGPGDRAAGAAPEASPVPAPPPQQVQRVLVFLFDENHIQPGGFDRARKAAIGFLAEDFRQGDVGGVVSGGGMVNGRLTSSREELEAALKSLKPSAGVNLVRELRDWPRFVDIIEAFRVTRNEAGYNPGPRVLDDVVERACRDRPDECAGPNQREAVEIQCGHKAIQLVNEGRLAGKQTLDTISGLANGLARLPGRKTIILLTEGFFIEDNWADLRGVVGRAARASVRIYALDTRGLNRGSASSDILNAAAPSPELSAPSLGDTNADGPNSLAVDTGGYVIRNENDFGKAFAEIDRDTSSYYVVGFRTLAPPDGKYHGISVRVKRSGVSVRARKGYVSSETALAAGAGGPGVAPPAAGVPTNPPFIPPTGLPPTAESKVAAPPTPDAPAPTGGGAPAAGAGVEPLAVRARPRVTDNVSELTSIGAGSAKGKPGANDAAVRQARNGWEAYQKGDLKSARELLGEASQAPTAPPWVHYAFGWSLFAAAEHAQAGAAWERVRSAVPEFEPVYFDLADAYLQQREFAKAVAVLRDAEGRWPKDVDIFNALGVAQLARGSVDDAVATFEKAVAVAPNDANACYNLAKTYEVRQVRSERLRKVGPGSIGVDSALQDRNNAITYYQRVLAIGGPLVDAAKEGLKRLGQGQ